MKKVILFFLIISCLCTNIFAIHYDSLFIDSLKKFANKEFGIQLYSKLYTIWSETNNPNVYLFVSLKNRVQTPFGINVTNRYDFNDLTIDSIIEKHEEFGYEIFKYYAYCNVATLLNVRLLSYSYESISFIVFHELLHNYFFQKKIEIPLELNEAACDVIGNYCTLKYSKINNRIDKNKVKKMIELNEKTYEIMNKYILRINQETEDVCELCDQCNGELYLLSKDFDLFQKDRFYYTVNTAYLLKNSLYSTNYFLLKKIFKKSKSIQEFLEILNKVPTTEQQRVIYFENYK